MADPHHSSEDRFVGYILQIANWAQRNTRALILALGAAAILVFAVKYYVDYKQRVRDLAATEMRNLRGMLEASQPDQVVQQLRAYIVQFDGTSYAREARVLLAHSLLLTNRAAEAIEPARQAIDALGRDVLSTRAAFLLAAAYEETGDTTAAVDVYRQIAGRVQLRVQKSRALEGAARLLSARGDVLQAAAIYDELAELTPEEAPARAFYEMRAAEMRARQPWSGEMELGEGVGEDSVSPGG
jgi:predicted negative regulator of RcsB-dependent stress response